VVALAAGATVVVASVMGRRRRRPPEQSGLAVPVPATDPVLAPVADLSPARATHAAVTAPSAGVAADAEAEPGWPLKPPAGSGGDLRPPAHDGVGHGADPGPASADAGASGSIEWHATAGRAGTRKVVGSAPNEPRPVEPADTTSTGSSAPERALPPNESWPVEPADTTSTGSSAPERALPPNEPAASAAAAAAAGTPDAHTDGSSDRPAGLAPRRTRDPARSAPRHIRDRGGAGTGRRSRAVLGIVVALALAVGVGAVVASATGGDGPGSASSVGAERDGAAAPPTQAPADTVTTTTQPAPVTAATAFAAAAERLTAAGTFSYSGTVSATDVSHVRPMLWLSVESSIEGQVSLPAGRLHETATTGDGRVAETVTSGPQVWGRRADSREGLAAVAYETVPALSGAEPATRGAVLLPAWLASAVGPADAGLDESGRRRFSATVPGAALGPIERERAPVDAAVVLTLDAAGAPVRVELTSAPGGPALHLVYDLVGLGTPVDIQPPA
jgi:hypothetical protein